ncbi:MAG: hypothetical protein WHX53_11205, partial [Anaerolineae bacterium]
VTPTVAPTRRPEQKVSPPAPTPTPQADKADDNLLNSFILMLLTFAEAAALVVGFMWLVRSRSR